MSTFVAPFTVVALTVCLGGCAMQPRQVAYGGYGGYVQPYGAAPYAQPASPYAGYGYPVGTPVYSPAAPYGTPNYPPAYSPTVPYSAPPYPPAGVAAAGAVSTPTQPAIMPAAPRSSPPPASRPAINAHQQSPVVAAHGRQPSAAANPQGASSLGKKPHAPGATALKTQRRPGPPRVFSVPVSQISVHLAVAKDYQEYLPWHVKFTCTPAVLAKLTQQIGGMPLTLGRTPAGVYMQPNVWAKPKQTFVTRPLLRFSASKPVLYNISAFRAMFWKINRLVRWKFYRLDIGAMIVPLGLDIHWSKGIVDLRAKSKRHAQGRTRLVLDVVLVPHQPFAPATTYGQFDQHGNWLDHFRSPLENLLNNQSGMKAVLAGDISPTQNVVPQIDMYRSASRFRRVAMDWHGLLMPKERMLRLARAGNLIARFELAGRAHKAPVPQANPNSTNTNQNAPTEFRLNDSGHAGLPPIPSARQMRDLRNQARTSWTAFYQLDTYAAIPRSESVYRRGRFSAARYFMGTLFDPRRTYDERVVPKSAQLAAAWYRSASVGRPMPLPEQQALGLKHSYATGPRCQQVWLHAQVALAVLCANSHPARALRYTTAAAKAGITAAMNNLAVMMAGRNPFFLTHRRLPSQSTHHWLVRAAMRGDATAEHNLACYWKNRGLFAARTHRFPLANACYKKAIAWYLLSIHHTSIAKHQRGYESLLRSVRYNVLRGRRMTRRRFPRRHTATKLMLAFDKRYVVPVPAAIANLKWYCTHCPAPAAVAQHNLAVLYSQRR